MKAPHREVAGIFEILAGVHSFIHDASLEEDLKQRTAAVEEGWRPWQGVWLRTTERSAEVCVWTTDASNDRLSDDDREWIEDKFKKCVEHLEYFLGPATHGAPKGAIDNFHRFDDGVGAPACARWDHDVARFSVYLEHEDSDLPVCLFVRAES